MFLKAEPIWIRGKEREMNIHAVFTTAAEVPEGACLHIAGTAFYRIFVNGEFLAFGPARAAEGYVREDVLPLPKGRNRVVVEAAGYYCRSLSTVRQPSFIMAEIRAEEDVIAYTGKDFEGFLPGVRVQKTDRYSVQRHFSEVWDYRGVQSLCGESCGAQIMPLKETEGWEPPKVLKRRAPYPDYTERTLIEADRVGEFAFDDTLPYRNHRYSWADISEDWGRYEDGEIPFRPFPWIQRQRQTVKERRKKLELTLTEGEYAVFDFGRIEAGFLTAEIAGRAESDVVVGFSEFFEGEEFRFSGMNAENVLEYLPGEGERKIMSFEPYTFRYVIVMAKKGPVTVRSFGMKSYAYDVSGVSVPECETAAQKNIMNAAVRTFAHNAVDLYTDCPSRERGGWLCDSYFTAKAEYAITGKTAVEDAFLENYRLFQNRGEYPEGVLPMCYPSDMPPGEQSFIPQWTLWYILEAEEYVLTRGHEDMAEAFRDSIYGLLGFYRRYENEDGLLEDLPAWNFVEWSKANEWTKDVNYPTNFLYARALDAIGHLYGDGECRRRAGEVRRAAVSQSFNGRYFLDHAVRKEDGRLQVLADSSEACQYYAALFGGIDLDEERYAYLKNLILCVFGPDRQGKMPEIFEVNAFIGAYLRMETLLRMKEYRRALDDAEKFFGKMSAFTQTLWEYREFRGSMDHGFASYVYAVICEALKGKNKAPA